MKIDLLTKTQNERKKETIFSAISIAPTNEQSIINITKKIPLDPCSSFDDVIRYKTSKFHELTLPKFYIAADINRGTTISPTAVF